MSQIAIRVDELGKRYRIGLIQQRGRRTLREVIADVAAAPVRNLDRLRRLSSFRDDAPADDVIWALSDVSFEVRHGEVVGVIGSNGAGKSTLLKILSRITLPSRGRAAVYGRVGALLEVGTGFHPELTGRDNVFLNGSILGMDRAAIARRFEEIVEFAGVAKFIDTPVKRYSSGMKVRLAFAVAAHLEPEILIVDEVLAVGDAEFQRKCLGKMAAVSGEGRTILFVSHNLVAVRGLCSRALWLGDGRVIMDGEVHPVVSAYLKKTVTAEGGSSWTADNRHLPSSDSVRMLWARVRPDNGTPDDVIDVHSPISIEFAYQPLVDSTLRPRLHLINQERMIVFKSGPPVPAATPRNSEVRYTCRIPGDLLNNGRYTLNLLLIDEKDGVALQVRDFLSFEVADAPTLRGHWFGEWGGIVRPLLDWQVEPTEEVAKAGKALEARTPSELALK